MNDSGGKDSQAMRIVLREFIPAAQILVVHATLGEVEWPGALEHARKGALQDGLPFAVARAGKTLLDMVRSRHAARPDVPCWPSSGCRQCTSDLKRDPIAKLVRAYAKEHGFKDVVNCLGIRAEESHARAKKPVLVKSGRNSIAARSWFEWLPIHGVNNDDLWQILYSAEEEPHYAYELGNERLSCMFCIMGSPNDLQNAARVNPELLRKYVQIEVETGYTMHMSRKPLVEIVHADGLLSVANSAEAMA